MYEKTIRTNATNKFDLDSIVGKLAPVPQSDCHLDMWKRDQTCFVGQFAWLWGSYLTNDRFSIQVDRQRVLSVLLQLDFCFASRIFIL